jgi:hypothetical protein
MPLTDMQQQQQMAQPDSCNASPAAKTIACALGGHASPSDMALVNPLCTFAAEASQRNDETHEVRHPQNLMPLLI